MATNESFEIGVQISSNPTHRHVHATIDACWQISQNIFDFPKPKELILILDTWLVNSFGFRILELEMATNESFEIGVQISAKPIFKMAEGNLANVKNTWMNT